MQLQVFNTLKQGNAKTNIYDSHITRQSMIARFLYVIPEYITAISYVYFYGNSQAAWQEISGPLTLLKMFPLALKTGVILFS